MEINLKGEELLKFLTNTIINKGYGHNNIKYEPNLHKIVWHGSFEENRFEICYNRLILHGAKLQLAKDQWDTTICIITNLTAFENAVEQLEYINEPINTNHVKSPDETFRILNKQCPEFINWLKKDAGIVNEIDLIDCVAKLQPINLTKVHEDGQLLGYILEDGD